MDRIIDLSGIWDIRQVNGKIRLQGRVPGLVHHDLVEQGILPDPYLRMNEKDQQWVAESVWEYSRTFELSDVQVQRRAVTLDCEGLDTVAEIAVNGKPVGKTDNMFLRYRFDIKPFVRPGTNTISIRFHPPAAEMLRRGQAYPIDLPHLRFGPFDPPHRNFLRKCHAHAGWDWGPCLLPQGPYRPVRIECRDGGRILSLTHRQEHHPNRVVVRVTARIESPATQYAQVLFTLGNLSNPLTVHLKQGENLVEDSFEVLHPGLWWPNGLGEPFLHELSAAVLCAGETDAVHQHIGLRKVELVQEDDRHGRSFLFRVNGVPLYIKGVNWIPGDILDSRLPDDRIVQDLTAAAEAGCNMVRVWGGGLYERDAFYRTCDRLGLLVWQDLMFACHPYPVSPDFLASVTKEVRHQVRRLQHHPSIALWCGNNEVEQVIASTPEPSRSRLLVEYDQLFIQTLEPLLRQEDPDRPYWPSSPSNGPRTYTDPNDPDRGDTHIWDVWHKDNPYPHYTTITPRFVSEFGFQSLPAAETLAACTEPEDRNLSSAVLDFRQRSPNGNATILKHIALHFRTPSTWETTIYLSQVHQAEAVRTAVEHWRRSRPRTMGCLVWQLNDIWPAPSWSAIDHAGRPKLLLHTLRHAFANLLVTAVRNDEKVSVFAVSDIPEPLHGHLTVRLRSLPSGKTIQTLETKTDIPGLSSRRIFEFRLPEETDPRTLCAELLLETDTLRSRNTLFFAPYKHLALDDPGLSWELDDDTLVLTSHHAALFVHVNTGQARGSWDDNGFHLFPGERRRLTFRPWPRDDRSALRALKKGLAILDLRTATA